jgi:CBS domain-containing protein
MAEQNTANPRHDLLAAERTPIGQLALRKLVTVPSGATLREVANRLEQANVSSALVDTDGMPRDFVTERDLARGLAKGRGPDDPVGTVATRGLVWATTTTTLGEAADMMVQHEIRHLVVLAADGEAVGVLSMRDVFPVLLRRARQLTFPAADNRIVGPPG